MILSGGWRIALLGSYSTLENLLEAVSRSLVHEISIFESGYRFEHKEHQFDW